MIEYEIQLRYVIRGKIQSESVLDKIQSKTKFSLRKIQEFFQKKYCWKKKFVGKKILRFFLRLNFVLDVVSDFQCTFLSCLGQIDAYHH